MKPWFGRRAECRPQRLARVLNRHDARGVRWGSQVFSQALSAVTATPKAGFRIIVNLTHHAIVSQHFLTWMDEQLCGSRLHTGRLMLQISEADVLIAQHHLDGFLARLSALGIALGIAQFGCTPAPARYLSLCHASLVRLDQSLIQAAGGGPEQRQPLITLIRQLHDRGIQVMAPGIESLAALPWLWHCGVDLLQGYALHRPAGEPRAFSIPHVALRSRHHSQG